MTNPATLAIQPDSTLRSIALAEPATITVLERFQLDYCCGGNRPLDQACAAKNLSVAEVIAQLQAAPAAGAQSARDLSNESLTAIIAEIVGAHHAYVRNQLPQLLTMAAKVAAKHGPAHPGFVELERMLQALAEELTQHLAKEELILFPYIEKLEQSLTAGGALPHACFASVQSPIAAMLHEHENAGALLEQMRAVTGDYAVPADACTTVLGLFAGLAAFERDLHLHIHRENNLLFPRAVELENSAVFTA